MLSKIPIELKHTPIFWCIILKWKIISWSLEILEVGVISPFSPLPSNTMGSQSKIRNHFIDLPQEQMVQKRKVLTNPSHQCLLFTEWLCTESEGALVGIKTKQGNWVNQSLMSLSEKAGRLSHDCDEFPFKNGNTHPLGYRILQLFLLHRWTFHRRQRCFETRVNARLLPGSTWISVMSIFPGDLPFISALGLTKSFFWMTQDFLSSLMQFI